MNKRLIDFFMSKPLLTYALLLTFTLTAGAFIFNIKVDTDPENMLAESEPARLFHNQVKHDFLLNDLIVVGAVASNEKSIFNNQSLTDLKSLSDQILRIKGVQANEVNSLSTIDSISQLEPGTIRFDWMMAQAPTTQTEIDILQKHALRLPFVVNSLVSGDTRAASIYVPIFDKNESYRISQEIYQAIETLSTANQYYITGLPVAEDTFGFEMFIQMGISAPLAALVIYLLMLYFFRSATLVIAPMIVAMSTVIIVMGAMIGAGFTVHIMSSMIPIFLMPIAVVDSVHLMSEFADRYKPGEKAKDVIREVTMHLFKPMLFTSVTSAAGFFSLMLTPIPPVQIFGVFVGCGILLAFLVTVIFVPVYVSRMSQIQLSKMQSKLHDGKNNQGLLAKILPSWGKFSLAKSKVIMLFSLVIIVVSVAGITKIEINDNPVRWFKSDHPIREADRVLNKHFAGTYDAHLVFSVDNVDESIQQWKLQIQQLMVGTTLSQQSIATINQFFADFAENDIYQAFILKLDDLTFEVDQTEIPALNSMLKLTEEFSSQMRAFTHPDNLKYIELLQEHLLTTGLVGKSNSLVDLVKTVNRELRSGQEEDFTIPQSSNAVSQTLLQFQSSHRPQDLWHFVTPDYLQTLVWLQMTSGDNQDMAKVIAAVSEYIKSNPLPSGLKSNWAGKAYINLVWQEKMVAGMLSSLGSAFIIVFIMMVLLFRSFIYGILAMLPLTITIVFMYGMIGWLGKYYDMPIAVLSALTLGLSVDFAIHFIERSRAFYQQTSSWKTTVEMMFQEPARAISRNALVIALGFTPLLLAPLVPYITVGVFLATIMAVSALVTILVLPASMNLLKNHLFKADLK